jgi:sarcosine oxidase
MTKATYDFAVIGVGSMGSSALFHLARRGYRVIGFEQFRVVHDLGSHTGRTRIIRHAYFESPDYVPLVLRSHQLWLELQKSSGCLLLVQTGGLDIGPENGILFLGALNSCKLHRLPYSVLNASEVMKMWPQFQIPDHWKAVFNEDGGFLLVDSCINAHVGGAEAFGARICEDEQVMEVDDETSHVRIRTNKGSYDAAKAILCSGPWSSAFLRELRLPLQVTRQPFCWFEASNPKDFTAEKFPVFLAEDSNGVFYGLPIHHHPGVKLAHHKHGSVTNPDQVDRTFHTEDGKPVQEFAKDYLPGLKREILEGQVCLYTVTPDSHFILDHHPLHKNLVLAAGFSGHGFKFAPVIGEILADLAIDGQTQHPIGLFRISRFL